MNRLMILVAFLVVALVAAPAIAENGPTDEGGETPVTEDPPPALENPVIEDPPPALENPVIEDPPPALENPVIEDPPVLEPPALEPPVLEPPTQEDGGPVSDTSTDDTSPVPGDIPGTNTGDDTNTADDKDDDIVEDTANKGTDEVTKDEIGDAENRADRIADRILADLKDGKKDKDEDDANKDGVEQSQDQDADSGDANQDADVINTGDNVNQCVGILQVANTGNAQNATGITQFDSEADEIELENGSRITLTPQLVVDCRQIILQIVRGERPNESKISKAKLREVIQPRSGGVPNQVSGIPGRVSAGAAVPTGRLGAAAAPKVLSASRAGQPKTASLRRSLPRTGGFSGYATLLGLGAGTLLVGGGLLLRKLSR